MFCIQLHQIYIMPELPEVETVRRGLSAHLLGKRIVDVVVRQRSLRCPIPDDFHTYLIGMSLHQIERRAKYLIWHHDQSPMCVIHLGMSGSCRVLHHHVPPKKHDHVDIVFDDGQAMRYTDPRRFGLILPWCQGKTWIDRVGPEPWDVSLNGRSLYQKTSGRYTAIKVWLMDGKHIAGVGNIYATEALFLAGIRPVRPVCSLSIKDWDHLLMHIRDVLERSIEKGGSSLRDFCGTDGQSGYFQQDYWVYGRAGQSCLRCGEMVCQVKLSQRSSAYCPVCQT
jgi:formamidopyrimidine-DNA glycosylase